MSTRQQAAVAVSVLALVVLGGACARTSAGAPASSAPVGQSVSPAEAPGSTAGSASPSTSPAPSGRTTKRTASELRKALLSLKDVPPGFELEPDPGGDEAVQASSSRSGCQALVRLLNAATVPGSKAEAQVSFSGGQEGPFVEETLAALGSTTTAQAFVTGFRSAVQTCRTVSLTVDGLGTSPLSVREISFADLGDASFAVRFRASKGALAGFELIQVGVQSADVVVGTTFVGLDPADAAVATQDAVDKVKKKLGTSGSA